MSQARAFSVVLGTEPGESERPRILDEPAPDASPPAVGPAPRARPGRLIVAWALVGFAALSCAFACLVDALPFVG